MSHPGPSIPIPIVLVGLSGVTQNAHIPNLLNLRFQQSPPFQIAGVCDRDEDLRKGVAQALDVPEYEDMEDVCKDEAIQAVLIATPPDSHHALFTMALDAGKHIFMEKPLALSLHQAREITALAANARTTVQLGYMLRHHRDAQFAKTSIEDGVIGTPLSCQHLLVMPAEVSWPRRFATPPRQHLQWNEDLPIDGDRLPFNMWTDNSVHYLNLMQWWFGPVEAVFGHLRESGSMMMLRYKSGVLATHTLSPIRIKERREFTIFGTKGMLDVHLHYPSLNEAAGLFAQTRVADGIRSEIEGGHSDMYRNELVHFADAIRQGKTGDPAGVFPAGMHDILTVRAALKSSKTGREEPVEQAA